MISPKKIVAPIVINIGFEKLIAVACASGISVKQVNPASIPIAPKKPLIKNNLVLFILIAARPVDVSIGSMTINANRFRKKTTSRICKFSAAFLIKTTIIENKTIDIIFKIIALVWELCDLKNRTIWRLLRCLFFN
tara:strand:- start:462 stop:869 length:408 start_codon:yes stop_codon:yes gene_type:complete